VVTWTIGVAQARLGGIDPKAGGLGDTRDERHGNLRVVEAERESKRLVSALWVPLEVVADEVHARLRELDVVSGFGERDPRRTRPPRSGSMAVALRDPLSASARSEPSYPPRAGEPSMEAARGGSSRGNPSFAVAMLYSRASLPPRHDGKRGRHRFRMRDLGNRAKRRLCDQGEVLGHPLRARVRLDLYRG
jgi:hypothetical protein